MAKAKKKSSASVSRGKLRSMKSSNSFRDFVLDQLSGVKEVRARAMFGGVGIYADDIFFGILAADVLYLKTGDSNRADFEKAGSTPFRPYPDKPMTMPYYNVPIGVLEDAAELGQWAKRAIAVARAVTPRGARRVDRPTRRAAKG